MNKVATLAGIAASVALAVSLGACGTKTVVPQPTVTVTARPTLTSAVSSPYVTKAAAYLNAAYEHLRASGADAGSANWRSYCADLDMASSALSVAVRELHKAPASAQRAAAATWGFDLNYAWGDSMAAYRAGEHDPVACVKDCKAANRWFSKATAARANYETNYPQ